jgi:GNAT superfamily N-acetyltransferase
VDSLPSDDRGWFDLVLSNQPPLWRLYVEAIGGSVLEEDGLQAAIVPASPNRSFFNSVFYLDTDRLIESIPRLAQAYDDAGVHAWTVWIRATDQRAREALAAAGHVLDATPRAMGLELSDLREPDPDPELQVSEHLDAALETETMRQINETAYGYPAGDFPPLSPLPGTQLYLGALDGKTVGTALSWDRGDDCEITLVATLPEARGRGVAKRLLAHALIQARERGRSGTTLIATKLGYPVYTALGYRDVGGLEMWERRR